MTTLKKVACGLVAATLPAAVSADMTTLQLACPETIPRPFCKALQNAVQDQFDGVQINLTTQPGPAPLRFVPVKHGDHILQGYLEWRTQNGETHQGPALELSAMDAVISAQMLTGYAQQLVRLSDLPLSTIFPE